MPVNSIAFVAVILPLFQSFITSCQLSGVSIGFLPLYAPLPFAAAMPSALIAVNSSGSKAIFCECKWRNEQMPESVIDEFIDKAEMFSHKEKYFYFFSKNGFTDAALKKSGDNIKLIEFDDMF